MKKVEVVSTDCNLIKNNHTTKKTPHNYKFPDILYIFLNVPFQEQSFRAQKHPIMCPDPPINSYSSMKTPHNVPRTFRGM